MRPKSTTSTSRWNATYEVSSMARYAVGIDDMWWQEADDSGDAVEQARETLKDMSDEEIDDLDLRVMDIVTE